MTKIAYVGHKGSGKDTAALALRAVGFNHMAFATPLKDMLRSLLRYRGVSHDEIIRMLEGDLKEIPSRHLNGATPRRAMQTLGSEWGRDLIDRSIWLSSLDDRVEYLDPHGDGLDYVLTDCRFLNEAAHLRARGWVIVKIDRPDNGNSYDPHISEIEIPLIPADHILVNDCARSTDFIEKSRQLAISQGWIRA